MTRRPEATLSGVTTTTKTKAPAAKKTPAAKKPDAVALAAVDLARAAAEELESAAMVGDYLGHEVEEDRVVTHYFACLLPAYGGWRWAVTVARASRAKAATVSETLLLPGADALLAPAWVPWSERLRPGDLGPGDLLPTPEDDVRLVPAYTGDGELGEDDYENLGPLAWEIGLGRERVLSRIGRDDAADRWYFGEAGPDAPIAQAAPAQCVSCGFLLHMGGSFSQAFGVCANEYSPSDGRAVSLNHGCGAHSQVAVTPVIAAPPEPVVDDIRFDVIVVQTAEQGEASVEASAPAEELGHS
jgi:hypothetical protein